MGLFDWSFGRPHGPGVLLGDGNFDFPVVGTSFHQDALDRIAGVRTRNASRRYCAALLAPEPDHPAVAISVGGIPVGHIDREHALEFGDVLRQSGYADAACEALIVGGWLRGAADWGWVGLRLNAALPFRIISVDQYSPSPTPRAKASKAIAAGPHAAQGVLLSTNTHGPGPIGRARC
jgi:hypothetical protein